MSLANMLFNVYKKMNILFKILLFPLLIVISVLWIVGNLAHANTLAMFLIGMIVSAVLLYIYREQVFFYVDEFVDMVRRICSELI